MNPVRGPLHPPQWRRKLERPTYTLPRRFALATCVERHLSGWPLCTGALRWRAVMGACANAGPVRDPAKLNSGVAVRAMPRWGCLPRPVELSAGRKGRPRHTLYMDAAQTATVMTDRVADPLRGLSPCFGVWRAARLVRPGGAFAPAKRPRASPAARGGPKPPKYLGRGPAKPGGPGAGVRPPAAPGGPCQQPGPARRDTWPCPTSRHTPRRHAWAR